MSEAPRINASEATVLTALRDAVIATGIFAAPEHVIIGADPEDRTTQKRADRYCLLSLGADAADQGVTAGAGNDKLLVDGELLATVYLRLALDTGPQISHYVLDDAFGLFGVVQALRFGLHLLDPQLPSGEYILARPMRYKGRDRVERVKDRQGWGRTTLTFLLSYTPVLEANA